jgi:hypothetical protein
MSSRFVSIDEMISCAKRELAMRKRVYPKWIDSGRMNQRKADDEIAFMSAIVDHLLKASGRSREDNLL